MKEVTRVIEKEVVRPLPTPAAGSTAVPVVPVYGGQTLPNDQAFDSMFFEHYGVNPFIDTEDDHLSTFAMDVDTASYTVARRYIKEGQLPPQDAIRNVSSIVRHLWSEFTEQFWALRLWAVWTAKEHACPHCPQPYDDCGLLIHTSMGRDGGLGMPRMNRSGCAAYAA